jgi:hypothetical protein
LLGYGCETMPRGKVYYDERNELFPVPTKMWKIGDDPKPKQLHFRIYVTGESFGGMHGVKRPDGTTPPLLDRIVLHEGPFRIRDPNRGSQSQHNYYVDGKHDCFNGFLVEEMANMDAAMLDKVLEKGMSICDAAIGKALNRPKMKVVQEEDPTDFEVCWAEIEVQCRLGRHRSGGHALQLARRLRLKGFTVEIVFVHLFLGVYNPWDNSVRRDDRGPCGCHLTRGIASFAEAMREMHGCRLLMTLEPEESCTWTQSLRSSRDVLPIGGLLMQAGWAHRRRPHLQRHWLLSLCQLPKQCRGERLLRVVMYR